MAGTHTRPSGRERPRGRESAGREHATDLMWLAAIAVALIAFYLSTYAAHGYLFPVGADAPVYLGWARLAGHDGLSAVGGRPGVPAVTLMIGGTLGLGPVAIVAALEVVLAVSVALCAAALVASGAGRSPDRTEWIAAGIFAGLFGVHLAVGYVASLAAAALFVAAAAALACGTRRAAVGAAALLGAAGFAHPEFLAIGVGILLLSAISEFLREPDRGVGVDSEHGRIVLAVAGGLAVFGLGFVALLRGPAPMRVDTSRDDFLQRAGLGRMLRGLYAKRLVDHTSTYVPLVAIPLGVLGGRATSGFLGRFLRAWALVLVVGVAVGLVTGWFPAERIVTFAFVIPIAAGIGAVRLWKRVAGTTARSFRAAMASTLVAALGIAFGYGSFLAWFRTPPEIWPLEVQRATEAGRYASASPPGTRLVFTVSGREPIASFFATEAANTLRASVPPDRIRDVRVIAAGVRMLPPTEENRRLVELSTQAAFDGFSFGRHVLWFDLAPFDRTNFGKPFDAASADDRARQTPDVMSQGIAIAGAHPGPVGTADDPLQPSSPAGVAFATLAVFALVSLVGFGWARVTVGPGSGAFALAPAFGTAGLIVAGIALERMGVPLSGRAGPAAATALATATGYAMPLIRSAVSSRRRW